jgi:hypothetical protein
MRGLVFAAFLVSASGVSFAAPGQESLTNRDDQLIFSAVIAHTIRPELVARFARQAGSQGAPTLLVRDETQSLCRGPQDEYCIRPDDMEVFRRPDRSGSLLGSGYSAALRSELVDAFNLRNVDRRPFPGLNQSDVVLIPSADLSGTLKQWQDKAPGYLIFSSPGYSTDGHAVVIGNYVCGLCGHGWLFVLERSLDQWRVLGAYDLWRS